VIKVLQKIKICLGKEKYKEGVMKEKGKMEKKEDDEK
jgi:hypothetical protein